MRNSEMKKMMIERTYREERARNDALEAMAAAPLGGLLAILILIELLPYIILGLAVISGTVFAVYCYVQQVKKEIELRKRKL